MQNFGDRQIYFGTQSSLRGVVSVRKLAGIDLDGVRNPSLPVHKLHLVGADGFVRLVAEPTALSLVALTEVLDVVEGVVPDLEEIAVGLGATSEGGAGGDDFVEKHRRMVVFSDTNVHGIRQTTKFNWLS